MISEAFVVNVNLEGCKTKFDFIWKTFLFESLVNLEGCKTYAR